jgi:transcriptional antiterminator RfaH
MGAKKEASTIARVIKAKDQAMLWYAVHSRPKQEHRALENLQNQGYEAWLPMITLEKLRRGRVTEVVEPMFSRYLFIRLDMEHTNWTPIRSTLGVSRLVSFGNRPAPIADVLIQTLRNMPERPPEKLLQPGQAVRVIEGPLKGLEAVYHQTDGELRAMVLVDLMSKQHLVSVETQHLFPVSM